MICGRTAGRVAAAHSLKGTGLKEYEDIWRREVYGPLRTAVRTNHMASLFMGSPGRLELSMLMLGERRMGNILRCKPSFP